MDDDPQLPQDILHEVHGAIVRVGMKLDSITTDLPRAIKADLPAGDTESGRILGSLAVLNRMRVSVGPSPLTTVLLTARTLAQHRTEAAVLQRALDLVAPLDGTASGPPVSTAAHERPSRSSLPGPALQKPLPDLVNELEKQLLARERCVGNDVARRGLTTQIDAIVRAILEFGRAAPGRMVAGCELIKPIGSGNFGTIWLSRLPATDELLATKVFHLDKLTEGRMLWHFRRSIRAMQILQKSSHASPNIVRIREVDQSTLAFSMDYLSEGNLEDVQVRGWTLEKKLEVFVAICRAVQYAHDANVIHRDIKPANVVLDKGLVPVLTDFDIADIRFVTRLSMHAGGLGTPVFAAPEQLEDANNADERSDIYSLGRLLYFLFIERPPALQIEKEPSLDNLREQPAALVDIVRRATALSPERRFSSVSEMISVLERYKTRWAAISAVVNRARRWIRVNAAMLVIFLLITAASVTAAIVQTYQAERERKMAAAEQTARLAEASARRAEASARSAEASARVDAETLQKELADALEKLEGVSEKFSQLEAQKNTLRTEISRSEAELDVLRDKQRELPLGSAARKKCDEDIDRVTAQLSLLQDQQKAVDAQAQKVKEELDKAVQRAKALKASQNSWEKLGATKEERAKGIEAAGKRCGCKANDLSCALKCIGKE